MRIKILLVVLIFFSIETYGREFPSINYTQNDGLPSDIIYDIYQDAQGYIWFATDRGVSRFNGLKFENFTTNDGLADNVCFYFRADHYGRLWIGSYNGELQYFKDGIFHNAKNTPFLKLPFSGGTIIDINIQKDSAITIHFRDKSIFLVIKDRALKIYSFKKNPPTPYIDSIGDIIRKNNNIFLINSYKDIKIVDTNLNVIETKKYKEKSFLLEKYLAGQSQSYYLSNRNIYDKEFNFIANIPKEIYNVQSINRVFVLDSNLYIATNTGLFINGVLYFKGLNISTVFVDKGRNIWLSTIDNGVFKLSKNHSKSYIINNALKSSAMFVQSKGEHLFVNTKDRDFYRFSNGTCSFHFDFFENVKRPVRSTSFGCYYNNYLLFNISKFNSYRINGIYNQHPSIDFLQRSNDDEVNFLFRIDTSIYLGNRSHVFSLDTNRLTKKNHNVECGFPLYIDNKLSNHFNFFIYSVASDTSDKAAWFVTSNGLYKVIGNKSFHQTQFANYRFRFISFVSRFLVGYTLDNKLLIASNYNNRNIRIDSLVINSSVWESLFKINDSSIIVFANDNYYLLTLPKFTSELKYSFRIIENQFIPKSADMFCCDSANCYFFKKSTIYKFPLIDLYNTVEKPFILFSNLKSLEKTYKIEPNISLSYGESRNIRIQYSVVSMGVDKLHYEFSITSGENSNIEKWNNSDGENINLVKIGAGNYTIKIRAKTNSGVYSNIQSFNLIVKNPFWFTWWFISGIILMLLLCIVYFISLFNKKHRIASEKEIKFLKSEFKALNALMNPHFIFNTLNSVQSLINRGDRQNASDYIRVISDVIRQNMYNISKELIPIDMEMKLVYDYLKLEKMRFNDRLHFTVDIDDDAETDLILIPPLLIQPLVENSIKYGFRNSQKNIEIGIKIYLKAHVVCIDVSDNGVGLQSTKVHETEHQSTALNNIKQRLEQLSKIHNKKFMFSIAEIKDDNNEIRGVVSSVYIYE